MLHYTYTASGSKISQQLEDDGRLGTRREYAGPFVYVNNNLGWINTIYGRIVAVPKGGLRKELHLRDHTSTSLSTGLGNTRMVLEERDRNYEVVQEAAYYPFGIAIPSQSFALPNENNTYQNRYLYNGKEYQDDFGLNWYDYGARFYDAQIARWHSVDPAAALYYSLSPYHYGGNSPINTIDIDGRLFIYVNGFMYDHWKPWSGTTYAPDRNFYSDGPRNAGSLFERDYWEGLSGMFSDMFNDPNMLFTSGSFKPWTMGGTRFSEGYNQAQVLINMLESGEVSLQDGETIKIVGHSHGAAYAAGLATALLEHPKYKHLLEFVLYFAPDQPNQFSHPEGVPGYQFSTKSDWVSSTGPLAWLRGSKYRLIDGAQWALEREKYPDSRGGHGMDALIRAILDWANSYGIPVYVFE